MPSEFPTTSHGFVLARDARAAGRQSELETEVHAQRLERVRRGVYRRPQPDPDSWSSAQRAAEAHRRQVYAASETLRNPIFTSYSAIALHGLPIIGGWPQQVFVLAPADHGYRRSSTVGVARLDDVALTRVGGLVVTSIEHSLVQLCRHATLGAALVAVEAAVAAMPWTNAVPRTTLDRLRAEHDRLTPYPGCRKVLAVLSRASSLSGSPLETCSKLRFEEFGFPTPAQQQRFWLPEAGMFAYVDFHWPDHGAVGEADGDGKYLSTTTTTDGVRALIDEKERELELRRQVGAFDRWRWQHMWAGEPLAHRLRGLGLPAGPRRLALL
ncbi:hypothetical protein [Agromyces italicus]|uniref:hypothetical protein n=1 Tax=Agromyces italicus TaxID=279572 RepID=UPI0003B655A2|nr:hypothetical protein [Agromyces italicus]